MSIPAPYIVHKFKLVHFDKYNPKQIYSSMYISENEALFGIKDVPKGNDYLIFKLIFNKKGNYNWEALPYGKYQSFIIWNWIIARGLIIGLILLTLYITFKK